MLFSTVIEIIVAVFTVYGLYHLSKQIALYLAYDKKIRSSVKIAVEIEKSDDAETKELKKMYARELAKDVFSGNEYIIICNDDKT
ncbi:MAG: hypothetical protein E7635_04920 [Ruminococcaceae bacterium]|nr:hypothetical protein [Oscillospiraceae bacterium]